LKIERIRYSELNRGLLEELLKREIGRKIIPDDLMKSG
jgi:hypothetical protein